MNGIAYFIRKRRRRVADVAELLGISEISCRFYLYYSPERVLTIQVRRIQKIAKILDVSIDDLLKSYDPAKLEAGDRAPVRSRTKRPEQNCVDRYRREKNITLEMLGKMMGVSRQAVHEMITRATEKMVSTEEKLHLAARFQRMEQSLSECRELLRAGETPRAITLLDDLIRLEQEENNGL